METLNIFEYCKRVGILEYILDNYAEIPNTIDELINLLDKEKLNFWSYSIEDKDEIKEYNNIVVVKDNKGCKRYFETEETKEF